MGSIVVEAKNVTKTFMGVRVLDNVSLSIALGERVAMMGPNGAGKTTFVRTVLGFYHIDGGSLRVEGFDPAKERTKVLQNIGFIPQLPPPVKLSISELLTFVQRSTGSPKEAIVAQAEAMDLDIRSHLHKPFFKLSGGMKQKLLIAIALARRSRLLIFDEPTANLDPKAREHFYRLLSSIDYEHSTIFITHRIEEIEGLANRRVYMDLGKVVEDERL
ncbi:ABC transporter ATP-binding protein [Hydrogenimonas urashimensis]|uniref:ABC transporter ATP-binding protein n=1 Tax=Hydrogenimonas urashimensis TaxID=2740515 RepID=UPI0019163D9C|nr:ABC transporter ATP-binding protein [Hydrogenimonas urashimensis]